MAEKENKEKGAEHQVEIVKEEFTPGTMEDDLRVDLLCKHLLQHFYQRLLDDGMSPEEATALANGADYFIRDFVVDYKSLNLFDEKPGIVRQFAGNWYILGTVDPDIRQLAGQLKGIKAFYRYLHELRLISAGYLENIEKECDDISYYEGRIESFWAISGDGYLAWEKECPLKDGRAPAGKA